MADRLLLPNVHVSELIPNHVASCVAEGGDPFGGMEYYELVVLSRMVRLLMPRAVFEFGTHLGRTTLTLASSVPDASRVYSIDVPGELMNETVFPVREDEQAFVRCAKQTLAFHGADVEHKITIIRADSARYDYAPLYGRMDLVLVDGGHSAACVLNDTEEALKLLPPGGGVIVWHDYDSVESVRSVLHYYYVRRPGMAGLKHIGATHLAMLDVGGRLAAARARSESRVAMGALD